MTPDPRAAATVVIHTSLRGLVGAVLAPAALLALGVAALVAAGAHPVPVVLIATGAGLGLVTAFDFPRHTRFDASGVTRVCVARRHHLPWSRLVAIQRARPTTGARLRGLAARRGEAPDVRVSGGLVARGTGRRRWLLTDRVESRLEYDRLATLMSALGTATRLRAPRPHPSAAPTDLYRRRVPGSSAPGRDGEAR